MFDFVALLFCFLVLASLIMPWVVRGRVADLQEEVAQLRSRLKQLERKSDGFEPEEISRPTVSPSPKTYVAPEVMEPFLIPEPAPDAPHPDKIWVAYKPHEEKKEPRPANGGFEMQFGARLPVWIGGIALALAGFYLVKYSIDTGILSPAVRSVIGVLFGIGLLGGGYKVRQKEDFADGTRIAQALSGAGIADLYACIFMATNIYHLLPATAGFLGMAAVTATAVILSLRHGAPIAALGLVGGFLTPALMGSDQPSAAMLFGYLYFVVAGLMLAVRHQGWWKLGLAVAGASFLWVIFWLVGGDFRADDAFCLCLFMLAITVTIFGISTWGTQAVKAESSPNKPVPFLNNIVAFAALVLCGVVMTKSGYGFMEWGLFWLISAGTIVMSLFRHQEYRALPWLSLAVSGGMLFLWYTSVSSASPLAVIAFALLYVVGGTVLQERSNRPFYWGSLAMSAATGFFMLAYFTIESRMPANLWGELALSLALAGLLGIKHLIKPLKESEPQRAPLLTVYVAGVTAFVSLALMILLDRTYLSAAFAAEVLALSFIATRVSLPSMKWIAGTVTGLFITLSLQELMDGFSILLHALFNVSSSDSYAETPAHPLIQFGLPALCFLGAALEWLRKKEDGAFVKFLEALGISLTALAFHYVVYWILYPGQIALHTEPGFLQRGIITNIIFLGGFVCLACGHHFGRVVFTKAGVLACLIAAFRICFLDLCLINPILDATQHVGQMPLFNALLITFGLPLLWTMCLIRAAAHTHEERWMPELSAFGLLVSFAFISFQVRQIFHGDVLTGAAGNVEVYTYSAVWLLYSMGLLFFGTLRKQRTLRIASLCLMVLTVGKVFLYDASELTGLYRVFSFFGLGLSLLGLSWFYSRFLLPKKE